MSNFFTSSSSYFRGFVLDNSNSPHHSTNSKCFNGMMPAQKRNNRNSFEITTFVVRQRRRRVVKWARELSRYMSEISLTLEYMLCWCLLLLFKCITSSSPHIYSFSVCAHIKALSLTGSYTLYIFFWICRGSLSNSLRPHCAFRGQHWTFQHICEAPTKAQVRFHQLTLSFYGFELAKNHNLS